MESGPDLFDVVELLADLPAHNLRAGDRGTVVDCYADNTFEVEFVTEHGETRVSCPISSEQFIVVWQAQARAWVPADEQIAALVARLPRGSEQEVLDFVRFLHLRRQSSAIESLAAAEEAGRKAN